MTLRSYTLMCVVFAIAINSIVDVETAWPDISAATSQVVASCQAPARIGQPADNKVGGGNPATMEDNGARLAGQAIGAFDWTAHDSSSRNWIAARLHFPPSLALHMGSLVNERLVDGGPGNRVGVQVEAEQFSSPTAAAAYNRAVYEWDCSLHEQVSASMQPTPESFVVVNCGCSAGSTYAEDSFVVGDYRVAVRDYLKSQYRTTEQLLAMSGLVLNAYQHPMPS